MRSEALGNWADTDVRSLSPHLCPIAPVQSGINNLADNQTPAPDCRAQVGLSLVLHGQATGELLQSSSTS